MKRCDSLRSLSEDHHHALALARRARRAGAGEGEASSEEVWAEVERRFATELEPHFRIEEEHLVPPLAALGEAGLARRVAADHAALRRCLQPGGPRRPSDLARFGRLLERHVRFEERELFAVAQERLAAAALEAVAAACEARGD